MHILQPQSIFSGSIFCFSKHTSPILHDNLCQIAVAKEEFLLIRYVHIFWLEHIPCSDFAVFLEVVFRQRRVAC